jgi:hypothetical protein
MAERSTKTRDYSGLGQSGGGQGVAGQQGICRNPKVSEKYATLNRSLAVEGVPQ